MGTARNLAEGSERRVRLIRASFPSPANRVQQLLVSALASEETLPWDHVVERVARELYLDELSRAGWAVDIGVFGARLFRPEVVRELQATRDVLWEVIVSPSSTETCPGSPRPRLDQE